jgi:pimeloyl-ACP methyl ester carboxylesterase
MADFQSFARNMRKFAHKSWPVLQIDLVGRGASPSPPKTEAYSTLEDAEDVSDLLRQLGIHRGIFFGQGHGGNVIMALGRRIPSIISATILCDAGAIINAQGLVRLRNNLKFLAKVRNEQDAIDAQRRIYANDYPSLGFGALDEIASRTHKWNAKKKRLEQQFDWRLIERLDAISNDDILNANWDLFDTLAPYPMLLMRTKNTDLLRADVHQRMLNRRPDALSIEIEGEGSPALLEHAEEIEQIVEFLLHCNKLEQRKK